MAQTGPVDDVMLRDPYEVLGVDRSATPQEVKSACESWHVLPPYCSGHRQVLLQGPHSSICPVVSAPYMYLRQCRHYFLIGCAVYERLLVQSCCIGVQDAP